MRGRRKPYTRLDLWGVKCVRCGQPSRQQWQLCALDNRYLAVCNECDVELNRMVLSFLHFDDANELIAKYTERLH